MHDSRFNPISKSEISQLKVNVSLLVGFEDGQNYLDWTVCFPDFGCDWWERLGDTFFSLWLIERLRDIVSREYVFSCDCRLIVDWVDERDWTVRWTELLSLAATYGAATLLWCELWVWGERSRGVRDTETKECRADKSKRQRGKSKWQCKWVITQNKLTTITLP